MKSEALHQKSIDLLKQGAASIEAAKFAEAEKQLRESLEINPSNPDTHYNLAIAYLQQGKWQEGEQSLKRTAEIAGVLAEIPQPAAPPGQILSGDLRQRAREPSYRSSRSSRFVAEGNKALDEKRFDDAVAKLQEALQSDKDADLYHNLAIALAETKKYDEADRSRRSGPQAQAAGEDLSGSKESDR